MSVLFTWVSPSRKGGHIEITPNDNRYGVYIADRETGILHTRSDIMIEKQVDGTTYQLGTVDIKSGLVTCNGRTATMNRVSKLRAHETFVAYNGMNYEWEVEPRGAHLKVEDESKRTIASFTAERGYFGAREPAQLIVHGDGLMMLDEVIATAVYIARKMVIRRNAQIAAGSATT
ncbi:hypothetical protein OE88DRAFT_1663241 [Heliocybe sulcata]|uniref:DUF6593 domain-containing protein n=1 Tax=Heliocybe sulcata TaxID=5364 RepID=A0A5C3MTX9_9AGAM|nr:hypothetical protein OE88DRAFT_1663241 [Heliocybe sulcata]